MGPNIYLNILFSNTLSLCSSFNVRDLASHEYSTPGIIIVLYFNFQILREKNNNNDDIIISSNNSISSITKTIISPVVLYGCETRSLTLREKRTFSEEWLGLKLNLLTSFLFVFVWMGWPLLPNMHCDLLKSIVLL